MRDLLRKRSQLVRQKTANLLSVQNLLTRNTGQAMNGTQIKQLTPTTVGELVPLPEQALALQVTVGVMQYLAGADQLRWNERCTCPSETAHGLSIALDRPRHWPDAGA